MRQFHSEISRTIAETKSPIGIFADSPCRHGIRQIVESERFYAEYANNQGNKC
jgi:hypothetical protein